MSVASSGSRSGGGTGSRATPGSGTSAHAAANDGASSLERPAAKKRGSRNLALLLMSLALAFYFGFIAITIYRSHH